MTTATSSIAETYEQLTKWWIQHELYDPTSVFALEGTFQESFCIRAAISHLKHTGGCDPSLYNSYYVEGDAKETDALIRKNIQTTSCDNEERIRFTHGIIGFCERVLDYQGVQGPPEALFMGYGLRVKDGSIEHSCVADQASVAMALVEAIELLSEHRDADKWLACAEKWANWILKEFALPNGGMGVGIFMHQWNPIKEYWCATSLSAQVLFKLTELTSNDKYAKQAHLSLGWLARFEFKKADFPHFDRSPTGTILYMMEGVVQGLKHIAETESLATAREHPAFIQLEDLASWLVENLEPEGKWPDPTTRGHRTYSIAVPWLLIQAATLADRDDWRQCALKAIDFMTTPEGQYYYGIFVKSWSCGLAWLSTGEALYDQTD